MKLSEKNWTNQKRGCEEFRFGRSGNLGVPVTEVQYIFVVFTYTVCLWYFGRACAGHSGSTLYASAVQIISRILYSHLICTDGVSLYSSISALFFTSQEKTDNNLSYLQHSYKKILNLSQRIQIIHISGDTGDTVIPNVDLFSFQLFNRFPV
jgi:hypothetical protein